MIYDKNTAFAFRLSASLPRDSRKAFLYSGFFQADQHIGYKRGHAQTFLAQSFPGQGVVVFPDAALLAELAPAVQDSGSFRFKTVLE